MSARLVLMPQISDAAAKRLHYLGSTKRVALEYADEFGYATFSNPTSRRLPQDWLELNRWILLGRENGGSRQWARCVRWLREMAPDCTTIVSYSDPSVGHTGALYRACNFIAAPTWHRLAPPPYRKWNALRQAAERQGSLDFPASERSETTSRARSGASLREPLPRTRVCGAKAPLAVRTAKGAP